VSLLRQNRSAEFGRNKRRGSLQFYRYLKRRPERMNNYGAIVLKRMSQMGW
jgi:hypothetical protein